MGGGPSGIESVLGDQRFKVWSSPDGLRVAQLLPYAERVFVGSRTDLWTWNSDTDLAVHTPVDPAMNRAASMAREQILGNPVDLAARILRAVSNVAEVSVGAPQEVAGRATYTLRLAPLSQVIKIGEIDVAIDAETRVPLRVEVFPRGSMDPAINVGFSSVDFGPIDPGMFSFTPPPGAAVRQASLPDPLSTHGY